MGMCIAEACASQPFSYPSRQVGVGQSVGAHGLPVSPSVPEVKESEGYMTLMVMVVMDPGREVTRELPVSPPLEAGLLPPVTLPALACLSIVCFPLQPQQLRGWCSELCKV